MTFAARPERGLAIPQSWDQRTPATPRDIVDVLRAPAFQDMLRAQGGEAAPSTPAEFAAFMASEPRRLKTLIEVGGLQIE